VAVEEKTVVDYNEGNPSGDLETKGQHGKPRVPLVAVYPKEGTLNSDSPFAVLAAPWSEAGKQAGANDFLAYLREPAQQESFTDEGFRTYGGRPGKVVSDSEYLADDVGVVLSPPSAPVLSAVRATWSELRKRARVLLVLDVSGSMSQSAGAGNSRLELARAAAVNGLTQLSDTDEVGLWMFPGEGSQAHRQWLAMKPLGPQRQEMITRIQQLVPSGGTPLYAVTREASDVVRAQAGTNVINAVVVMTDGKNENPDDNDLDGLIRELGDQAVEGGIRVFTIAYGQDADLDTLRRISEASRAAAYDATDPLTINTVFTNVLSNF
jgi:Ca-activated chloride channel homolog